jgi:tripartite-type tricarboxylate transporter receptor subunit TctC
MPSRSKRRLLQCLALSAVWPALSTAPAAVHAQSGQTLRFLIGFPPGGGPDLVARLVAEQVRASRPWTTVVENRPGASGRIAISALRTAVPEPLTILVSPIEILTLLPHLYRNVGYDPFKDVVPIAALVETPYAIAVSGKSDFKTLQDHVQWCRANPQLANYGTPGEGTPQHLLGQVFARKAGIQLTHVAYKGGPPAIQDVIGGQISAVIATYSVLASYRASGALRDLAHSAGRKPRSSRACRSLPKADIPGWLPRAPFSCSRTRPCSATPQPASPGRSPGTSAPRNSRAPRPRWA